MLRRPLLRTTYEQDAAIFPTWFQRGAVSFLAVGCVLATLGFAFFDNVPAFFLGNRWIDPISNMMPLAIAALGFNILVGVAGQVSLGHAFFMGTGAYTAVALGGDGGLIAVDANGNIALPFNSEGMYRAWVKEGEEARVGIYKE